MAEGERPQFMASTNNGRLLQTDSVEEGQIAVPEVGNSFSEIRY